MALTLPCGSRVCQAKDRRAPTLVELVAAGHAAYVEAEVGLQEAIIARVPGVATVSIVLDGPDAVTKARRALAADPSLVLAIGSPAARLAREAAPGAPLVYAMILDPRSMGLPAPGDPPSRGATGVTMDVSPDSQFELMRELLPAARRIGVLYDPILSGVAVRRASEAAKAAGLTLVAQAVRSESEVTAAASLLTPAVDALWALADSTVLTPANARSLVLLSLRSRKPLFGVSEGFVRRGALAALAPDPKEVGRRAGELAARVLQGAPPGGLRPEPPPRLRLYINRATAGHMRVALPESVIARAHTVFPEP